MNKFYAISAIFILGGCAATYKQSNLSEASTGLQKGQQLVIAVSENGSYEGKTYESSGRDTSNAVRSAFAPFVANSRIVENCADITCLRSENALVSGYYVVPEILHWEDRSTEWSGKPDRIEIKVTVYSAADGEELASTIILGKSKWATMGGDHPQDLLSVPLKAYIDSLYQ